MAKKKIQKITNYYRTKESKWGYSFLLKGIRHFGHYPVGKENISIQEAQYLMVDKIGKALNLSKSAKVLDAGCGEGATAIYLAKNYGYSMYGIDLLEESIKEAIAKKEKFINSFNLKFNVADYSNTGFSDNYFDGIYTLETFVHSPDHKRTLKEFYRILKPGGKLILCEYTLKPLEQWKKNERHTMELIIKGSAMHSLPYFIHDSFGEILKNIGFENVEVRNYTQRILPMLKRFKRWASIPYRIIKVLNIEKRFPNTVWGLKHYDFAKQDKWRYVMVVAQKPS